MDNTNTSNVLADVLDIDIKNYMIANKFLPISEQRNLIFFPSPFKTESTEGPNDFVVDKLHNEWYSNSIGQRGNILDLDAKLHNSTLAEALDRLQSVALDKHRTTKDESQILPPAARTMSVVSIKDKIKDETIIAYLKEQRLSIILASRLFREFRFLQSGILHTGLGLTTSQDQPYIYVPNFGANYLRSDHKFFDFNSDKVNVFTNAPDLMHYMKMTERTGPPNNMLLLTDIYAFEKARTVMERHQQINLFFPKNSTTEQYIGYAKWLSPDYKDFSMSYGEHESLSKARMQGHKPQKDNLGKKI